MKSGNRPDSDWLSGQILETDTYTDSSADAGSPVSYTVNSYENPSDRATHKRAGLPDLVARYGSTRTTKTTTAVTTTGTWDTSTVTITDPGNNNRVTSSLSTADGTPDVCTRQSYASGGSAQMTALVSEVLVVSGANACTAGQTSANTVSDTRTLFDGQGFGGAGTKADVTGTQVLDGYDGNGAAQFVTTSATTYDAYGRIASVTDPTVTDGANPNGAVATTAYSSANPGELPNKVVTGSPAPAGAPDAGTARTTTTTLNPARAMALTSTDVNGRTTSQSYDGLGRLTAVWLPGRDAGSGASYSYDYAVNGTDSPSTVTTKSLRPGGTAYGKSTQIVDGLARAVQTQTDPAIAAYHGRLIADTFYDSQGRIGQSYQPYYEDTNVPNTTRWIPDGASVPNQSVVQFDGLGRAVSTQFVALGTLQATTTTAYPGADRVDVSPPAGATATSTVTDARGRKTQLWQYRTAAATGNQADADVTGYTYTPGGQAATRVDAAGNTWSFGYDQRGRVVRSDDPDTGVATRSYDGAGRLASTTDARGQSVAITYDLLNRKTGTYNGSVAPANQLTGYSYDTVVKGQITGSTRYVGGVGGSAYTKSVGEYDVAYRATRTSISIPGSEIGRTGQATFDYTAAYNPVSGSLVSEGRAAAGDLAQEAVNYNYEAYGQLNDVSGSGYTYLRQADWDAYGRNIRDTMNPWGTQVVSTNTYDEPTGRLLTQYVDKQTSTTGTVQNTTYAYNPAGRITGIRTTPDNSPDRTDLQCFSYDYLGRLTTAWSDTGRLNQPTPSLAGQGACANPTPTSGASTPGTTTVGGSAPYWQDYTYDAVGNRTKLVMHNPTGDQSKDLTLDQTFPATGARNTPTTAAGTGGGTGGVHAPTAVKSTFPNNGSVPGSYQYDAAGNTTKIANPGANKTMGAGFVLNPGESVRSSSVQLTMQPDGNLVLTSLRTGLVTWSSDTANHPGAWATMQDDGNFVVYDPQRVPLWSSQSWTGPNSKFFAVVQDDGKFMVYGPGWSPKWDSKTWTTVDAANGAEMTWDVEGKLATMKQGSATTSYVYDADGNQLIRRNPGKVTVNLGGGDELTYDTGSKTSTGTRYYSLPGGVTLVRQGANALTYQFADHHGTNSLSIDSATTAVNRRWTDPFGVLRGYGSANSWSGDKGYVGGLKDDATGFTNLGARQYQPATGRFLNPDPVIDAANPQQWNAYAYSTSDPTNLSDPGGLRPEGVCGGFGTCYTDKGDVITETFKPEGHGVWTEKYWSDGNGTAEFPNIVSPHYFIITRGGTLWGNVREATDSASWFPGLNVPATVLGAAMDIKDGKYLDAAEGLASILPGGRAVGVVGKAEKAEKAGATVAKDLEKVEGEVAGACPNPLLAATATHSFLPGTKVLLADGRSKAIEDLQPGDQVEATDPATGKSEPKPVTRTIRTPDDSWFTDLTLQATDPATGAAGRTENLTSTQHHPFWDETTHRWTDAANLRPGETVRTAEGRTLTIRTVRNYETAPQVAYDLTIADIHTYYVLAGETPVLVHNNGGIPECFAAGTPKHRVRDIEADAEGFIHPPTADELQTLKVSGASTYRTVGELRDQGLTGKVRNPNAPLPDGLGMIADGKDVGGTQPHGHITLYPTRKMTPEEFTGLLRGMDWQNSAVQH
ncbi:polymorphic toxin-type HINT domain-containing protein [Kitasatospora sp. NPDC089797]|uniref:polymorphic toxin-type HINT domain-containing protein n=1 Tax=Kitasatospora sp. NPDC089797 TaxID=3155298 RepID=UPI00341308FA